VQAYVASAASLVYTNDGSVYYGYYQASNGDLVEIVFSNTSFASSNDLEDANRTVALAENTYPKTPMAATSWTETAGTSFVSLWSHDNKASNMADSRQRALFFQNSAGMVMVTNTTGTQPWSTPYGILRDDHAVVQGVGLAVGSGTNKQTLNGVRVYYGTFNVHASHTTPMLTDHTASAAGLIQEAGTDFSGFGSTVQGPPWSIWKSFDNSDAGSGVAFTMNGPQMNLYVANQTSGALQQWSWNYETDNSWQCQSGRLQHARGDCRRPVEDI